MREDRVFQEQPTEAERGRGKRSKRSKAWRRGHDAIYAWRSDFIQQQQALINDRKWAAASKEYIDSLYMICSHLMMATEVWLQKLWLELICNYGTDDPKRMAAKMKQAMTDNNSSVLYRVQSIQVNSHYEGMVESRPAIQRKQEHDQCISDWKFRPEHRYQYMHKHGKAASWWFIPVVYGGIKVPKSQLLKLENTRIKSNQQCLNHNPKRKSNSRREKSVKTVQPATITTIGPKPVYKPKPMHLKVEGYYEANGKLEFVTSGDLIEMLLQCCIIMVHTSRLQYQFTSLLRTIGRSIYEAKASANHSFRGTLTHTLKWAAKLPHCWIRLTRITVKIHRPIIMLRATDMALIVGYRSALREGEDTM